MEFRSCWNLDDVKSQLEGLKAEISKNTQTGESGMYEKVTARVKELQEFLGIIEDSGESEDIVDYFFDKHPEDLALVASIIEQKLYVAYDDAEDYAENYISGCSCDGILEAFVDRTALAEALLSDESYDYLPGGELIIFYS